MAGEHGPVIIGLGQRYPMADRCSPAPFIDWPDLERDATAREQLAVACPDDKLRNMAAGPKQPRRAVECEAAADGILPPWKSTRYVLPYKTVMGCANRVAIHQHIDAGNTGVAQRPAIYRKPVSHRLSRHSVHQHGCVDLDTKISLPLLCRRSNGNRNGSRKFDRAHEVVRIAKRIMCNDAQRRIARDV